MAGYRITEIEHGYPLLLGANKVGNSYNFAVEVPPGQEASLLLYYRRGKTPALELPFSKSSRVGRVCSMRLADFPAKDYEYNFRINGEIVQDPCAYGIRGREKFAAPLCEDAHRVRCSFLPEEPYDWEDDRHPKLSYEEMILYKVHTRGYTKLAKTVPSAKKGSFAGLAEMIPYWTELGVNAIELMPSYEFWEIAPKEETKGLVSRRRDEERVNYWGYLPGFYFAPKASYCASKELQKEFRDFVKALHRAGMECILEFYFPAHTDPMTALRALQFWNLYYHVDGFQLVGEGVPTELLLKDGVLSGAKLLVAGYDVGALYPEQPPVKRSVAVLDYSFLTDMRRFLKSDEDVLSAAAGHIRANSNYHGVVNFMTHQDGFTLQDLVSYNYKNNEANGENNQDGCSHNYSWNCGVEGPTRKKAVTAIRERQVKNAFLMLLLSQGVPMIYGGDEFGNSQNGNNNAYCQDNEVGWTDWRAFPKNQGLFQFVKEAIAFRKAHSILHMGQELKESDYKAAGFPDISFHGERAWYAGHENTSRLLGVMYCGAYGKNPEEDLYVGYNFHWETRNLALPNLPEGRVWKKLADSGECPAEGAFSLRAGSCRKTIEIAPRTIIVLAAKQEDNDGTSLASL